ncbi:terminase large subunit, partial [Klebsiella pneumoniae]|uniref:terminase TerL endonuclease subunit n=1 Tax=Klebsiella pneumoniae TaxID=573 RepID=UPI00272FBE9F
IQLQDVTYYFTRDEVQPQEFDLSVFRGRKTYVGIDLSLVGDLTSIAYMTRLEDGTIYTHNQSFSTVNQYEGLDNDQKEVWNKFIEEGSVK